jgi:MazG family protein
MNDLEAIVRNPNLTPFDRLCKLMEVLRSPDGCQWDRAQTHRSLSPYLIEETYEVVESIEADDFDALKEELGDLALQIVFHAQLAREEGRFEINDVFELVSEKMIRRHPHIFAAKKDLKPGEVRDQWEKIKTESGEKESVLGGLPRSMPALTMAFRMGEKAGGVGFDWPSASEALEKVKEEVAELEAELANRENVDTDAAAEEVGDLLFSVASVARLTGVDPEAALKRALGKFRNRFELLEAEIFSDRGSYDKYTLDEMEAIWQRIKG